MTEIALSDNYTLTVIHTINGCENSLSVFVPVDIRYPEVVLPDSATLSCNIGSVIIQPVRISQGLQYNYSWYDRNGDLPDTQILPGISVNNEGLLYLQVIDNTNGCASVDSVVVVRLAEIVGAEVQIVDTCPDDPSGAIAITMISGGTSPYTIRLSRGSEVWTDTSAFNSLAAGAYLLTISDSQGCSWDTSLVIGTLPSVTIDLGVDITVNLGESVQLNAVITAPPGITYSLAWSPDTWLSCNDCPDPVSTPLEDISYTLTATDSNGCRTRDAIFIEVNDKVRIEWPNIISTNEDGVNDKFTIYTDEGVKKIKLIRIYDRWGNLVFENYDLPPNDPGYGWDGIFLGQPVNPGVFAFYAIAELVNGGEKLVKGDITVIR